MKRRPGRSAALAGLTPLLDTIFLLLFALLVTSETRTDSDTELVHVRLPEVEPAGTEAPGTAERVRIVIDAASTVRLADGGPVLASRADLDAALAAALGDALPEEVEVELHADADARHGVAIELLQHLRVRGFVRVQLVALGTETPDGRFGATR